MTHPLFAFSFKCICKSFIFRKKCPKRKDVLEFLCNFADDNSLEI